MHNMKKQAENEPQNGLTLRHKSIEYCHLHNCTMLNETDQQIPARL